MIYFNSQTFSKGYASGELFKEMKQIKEFVAKVKKQGENSDIEGQEQDSYKVVVLFNSVSDSLLNNEQ